MDALGVPLPVLLVLFPAGFVLTLAGAALQLLPRAGLRRAGAVVGAPGALLLAAGGSYPGAGLAWAAGALVAVLIGVLVALPLLPAAALPARTRANAARAALVLTLLDVHLLLDQPPASGLAVTLALVAAVAWVALRPAPTLPRPAHRLAVAGAVVVVVVGGFAWRTADSRHPGSFSMGDHAGHGGHAGHPASAAGSVAAAAAAPRTGDVRRLSLTARSDGGRLRFEPAELRFVQGERVEVVVRNLLAESTSVHWHGMRVPNAMDGVSGLTQDAIPPGGTFTYGFEVPDAGSYWFHAHQDSASQVARGLYGAVVVTPPGAAAAGVDRALLLQSIDDRVVLADAAGGQRADAAPGAPVRLRVVNTDEMAHAVTLRGAPFVVAALDGSDLDGATELTATSVTIPAGGRADLVYTQPAERAAVLQSVEQADAVYRTSPRAQQVPDPPAAGELRPFDADTYGVRRPDAVRDADRFDVDVTVRITTKFGFYDGGFGTYSFMDDRLYPHGRMLMVRPGDLVRVRLENRSYLVHPMHPHGHAMTVLEHDDRPVTGATRRLDSLQMQPGETWTVAFRADNPGLWMFHCHNLQHAVDGMDMMIGYEGATTPFRAGRDTGNRPE